MFDRNNGILALTAMLTLGFALPARAIDGVVEINQAKALAGGVTATDTAGFPVTIDAGGSYRLTGGLVGVVGQDGIVISSDNVTLDLNGFSVIGVPASGNGISGLSVKNVSLSNGTVRAWGLHGVDMSGTRNGTITDLNTGLMWEKKSNDGSIHDFDDIYDFSDAIGVHVATLNSTVFAGHSDWRLPNRRELESIQDLERSNPAVDPVFNTACAPGCTVLTCSCTAAAPYHSSTKTAWNPEDNWHVDFDRAEVFKGQTASEFVRAVRGGL